MRAAGSFKRRPVCVLLAGLCWPFGALAEAPAQTAPEQTVPDTVDVLLLGNSYIYFNTLPDLIEGIAAGLDGPVVRADAHTRGGQTLRGHLDDGRVPALLAGSEEGADWEWVVLQEQSTLGAPYDSETGALGSAATFHESARELVAMVREEGAEPAFYMTWAKEAFPSQSDVLASAYADIAQELSAGLAPVGRAFATVRRLRPDLGLYVSDGSHPNAAGSYLAACVIYASLTGESPIGAPAELTGTPWDYSGPVASSSPTILVSLSDEDALFLQRVAHRVAGVGPAREDDGRPRR